MADGVTDRVGEDTYKVELPEHVEISFTLAGFGSRFIAHLLDLLLIGALVIVLSMALGAAAFYFFMEGIGTFLSTGGEEELSDAMAGFILAVVVSLLGLALFVVSWLYFVIFETVWDGRSPGKRWCRLRVIRDNGGKVSLYTALLRNLVRVADWLPAFYLVGIITMFANKRWKRLGDFAAGTVVVKEEEPKWVSSRPLYWYSLPSGQLLSSFEVSGLVGSETLEKLGEGFCRLCLDYLRRRGSLPPHRARELAIKIASKPMQELGLRDVDPERFVEEVGVAWQKNTLKRNASVSSHGG